MTARHSIVHDFKKRTQREICRIHRQERCDTDMQGAKNNRQHPVSSDSHNDTWETMLPLQTKTASIEKHNQRCNNQKENGGDRME